MVCCVRNAKLSIFVMLIAENKEIIVLKRQSDLSFNLCVTTIKMTTIYKLAIRGMRISNLR